MENKVENKPMAKWLIYTLFILKFLLSLALIYWTVYMTFQSDVGQDDDNAFLSSYHNIDDNYNKMINETHIFNTKYNVKLVFNNEVIYGLDHVDVYFSQRVIQKRKTRKDILNVGENNFSILIQDKDGNKITKSKAEILVTKNTNHIEDVKLHFNNEETKTFKIGSKGYWNITGTVEVDGLKGYFYIKTNGKKHTK